MAELNLAVRVGGLLLRVDAARAGLPLTLPASYEAFRAAGDPEEGLALRLRRGGPGERARWRAVCVPPDTWELWQDEGGRYVFVSPREPPPRREAFVDAGFRSGEIVGEYVAPGGAPCFPLRDIDIVIYSNWLAETGDLILHAAGVELDGAAYCFAGASGAGKSTLARALADTGAARVMGEDNVVLRCLEGRFWAFGTPWHLDPARCSPCGAPLAKLFFLDRQGERGRQPCSGAEGAARLLQTAFVPYYRPEAVGRILDNLANLADQVPFFRLGYQMGCDVLPLVRE